MRNTTTRFLLMIIFVSFALCSFIPVIAESDHAKLVNEDPDSSFGLREISLQPDDYSGFRMALCVDQVNISTIKPDQLSDDGRVCYFDLTTEECKALLASAEPLSIGPDGAILWITSEERTLMVQHGKTLVILMQAVNRGAKDIALLLADELNEKRSSSYVVNGDVRWSMDGRYMFFNEPKKWYGLSYDIDDPYLTDTVTGEIFYIETDGKSKQLTASSSEYQCIVCGRFSDNSLNFDYVLRQHSNDNKDSYWLKRYNLLSGEIETIYGSDSRRIMDFLEVNSANWFVFDVDDQRNYEINHISLSTLRQQRCR